VLKLQIGDMTTASVMFAGLMRIVHLDANDNTIAELLEKTCGPTGELYSITANATKGTYETDPQKMPKVKKQNHTLGPYDKLVIKIKPNAALTADASGDDIVCRIPVTFRNTRSGVVYEKTLYINDFTDKIDADITLAANIWYTFLEYQLPAQTEMKLGHAVQDARVDSALYFAWTMDDGAA